MKKTIIFSICLLMISIVSYTQTLEHTYTGNKETGVAIVSRGVPKYYQLDRTATGFILSLYNTDYSTYKTTTVNTQSFMPAGSDTNSTFSSNISVHYITSSLFNTSDSIEFLCQIEYTYLDASENMVFGSHVVVYRDDATILFQKNNSSIHVSEVNGKNQFIYNVSNNAKMVLRTQTGIEIYNLVGTLPIE